MLPTSAGVEPATSWSPVGRRIQLSHRGRHRVMTNQSISSSTLCTLGKIFSRCHFDFFFQKTGFDISCKLSPKETICMKCQGLFLWKKKKKKEKYQSNVCWISPESGKGYFNLLNINLLNWNNSKWYLEYIYIYIYIYIYFFFLINFPRKRFEISFKRFPQEMIWM